MNTIYQTAYQPRIYWDQRTASGWTQVTTTPLPGWTHQGPKAAIGAYGGANNALVAVGIAGTDGYPYLARAPLPLTANTVWTEFQLSINPAIRTPAIAARKAGAPLWLAAWPNNWPGMCAQSGSGCAAGGTPCPGAIVVVSPDAFDTRAFIPVPGVCTVGEIALTHDQHDDLFVMAYTRRTAIDLGTLDVLNTANDSIVLRTSPDGFNWSPETSVDVSVNGSHYYDIASPGLACSRSGSCLLTWHADSSVNPTIVTAGFTVGPGGLPASIAPTITGCTDRTQRTLAAAATTFYGYDFFLMSELYSTNPADWPKSLGQSWVFESWTAPFPTGFCSSYNYVPGLVSSNAPSIAAGGDLLTDTYIFWTH